MCAESFTRGFDLGQVPSVSKQTDDDGKWTVDLWLGTSYYRLVCLDEVEAKGICQMWMFARAGTKKVILRLHEGVVNFDVY